MSKEILYFDEWFNNSKTYTAVKKHRMGCIHWVDGEICFDCFGGGLTRFTKNLLKEMKKDKIKPTNISDLDF